ncbi:MAG: hypothetical protein JO270_24015 [Acidobacteriaceae bacterium]|nr:hypothetical protein [Acidobacteriaceae bacterium]MBV8571389.1 hypothetical protein [Acidobacteriaceae bacterium]
MAYRSQATQPIAKIVVRAETHAQLNQILLALQRAVASYDRPVRQEEPVAR